MKNSYLLLLKFRSQWFSVFSVFLISCYFSGSASAYNLPNITIPAASCRPHADSEQKIKIDTGVWVFRSGQTGTAALYCPLPLRSDTATLISLGNFRVYYLDSDGSGTGVSVAVRLMHRKSNASGIWFSGSGWISDTAPQADQNKGWRTAYHLLGGGVNLATDQLYSFRVNLTRTSAVSVGFAGIDFQPLAIPFTKGECCGDVNGVCIAWCNKAGGCTGNTGSYCDAFLAP